MAEKKVILVFFILFFVFRLSQDNISLNKVVKQSIKNNLRKTRKKKHHGVRLMAEDFFDKNQLNHL